MKRDGREGRCEVKQRQRMEWIRCEEAKQRSVKHGKGVEGKWLEKAKSSVERNSREVDE